MSFIIKQKNKLSILVIGDSGVGKTCYIKKQLGEKFVTTYKATEDIQCYEDEDILWYDFPGQEKYVLHIRICKIDKVIYMYDITSNESLKNLNFWKEYVQRNYGNVDSINIGNKIDMYKYSKINNSDLKNTNI